VIRRPTGRLRRSGRQPGCRPGKVLILLYHRVARLRTDPWSLAVTPRRFGEQLEVLRREANPIRLGQYLRAHQDGSLPDRCVVVTFDDGYADNLHNAKPLLERYGVPATVFLASGFIGCQHEFWWDELDRLLLQPGRLPSKLSLSINGSDYRWRLAEAARYRRADYRRHRDWRVSGEEFVKPENAPTPRHTLYLSLWKQLHRMAEGHRRTVLDEIHKWADVESSSRPTHRILSVEEVVALAKGRLIEVGAHTVTHPSLSALPVASQRDEITSSKSQLEEILGSSVVSFAYPFGKQSDYSSETISLVRKAGFLRACTNVSGTVQPDSGPFRLPRIHVPNYGRERFAIWLSQWLNDRE
jgi:peptidoglycan/xylan/chitin deacetylase (PgdA/CDA1 family)